MRSEEITAILGPVDEALIAAIVQTGASAEELAQAWVCADDALIDQGRALSSGRVAERIDLPTTEDDHDEPIVD